jgi:hypothetical protein
MAADAVGGRKRAETRRVDSARLRRSSRMAPSNSVVMRRQRGASRNALNAPRRWRQAGKSRNVVTSRLEQSGRRKADFRNITALIALAVGRHPIADPPSACRHGRACPGHPRSAVSDTAVIRSKGVQNEALRPCSPFWSFVAPNHVDGLDKPGHDAFFCRRRSFQFRVPRAQQLTLGEQALHLRFSEHVLFCGVFP